jgi:hypothetical protein
MGAAGKHCRKPAGIAAKLQHGYLLGIATEFLNCRFCNLIGGGAEA